MGCASIKSAKSAKSLKKAEELKVGPGTFILHREESFSSVYNIHEELGSGAFSTVFKCIEKRTGKVRAVKVINKQWLCQEQVTSSKKLSEIMVLKQLDHPNILKIHEIFEDRKYFFVIMEFCSGGELFNRIIKKRFLSERKAAEIMYQLLSAIAYCHGKNIIHRDLKPENILLEEKGEELTIRIADFGNSVISEKKSKLTGCFGSVYYIAPEVLEDSYTEKCDEWSAGIIMYILLTGHPPFNGRSDREILFKIKTAELVTEGKYFSRVSEEAKDLLRKLVLRNVDKRLSAQEALEHPWLQKYKQETLPPNEELVNVLTDLSSFHSSSKLRNAILTFISAQQVTYQDTKKLEKAFGALDKNGDGTVSQEELLEVYKEVIGGPSPEKDVENIMRNVDVDRSGCIDYTEFIQACLAHEILYSKKNLESAFRLFDKDGSGTISATELKEILSDGKMSSDSVWAEIIDEVDQNGDGEIDLREFHSILVQKV